MSNLRKAAEQALEALDCDYDYDRPYAVTVAMNALRAALQREALNEVHQDMHEEAHAAAAVAAAVEAERAAILAACDMIWAAGGGYQRSAQLTQLMNWIRARSKP
jgi:hypothetical protein